MWNKWIGLIEDGSLHEERAEVIAGEGIYIRADEIWVLKYGSLYEGRVDVVVEEGESKLKERYWDAGRVSMRYVV
jgi:hypothetical protein